MIFKFNLISKYREELMGYAIFGVLVSHLLMWLDIKIPGVNMVLRLIYTQGFLFLSGFGLYYSLSKSSEILPFYKRRVKRLYIPFALMAFIPFLIRALQFEGSISNFFSYITTAYFWIHGNYNYWGMWYVAVSIMLYLAYPFLHKFIFFSNKKIVLKSVVCFVLAIAFFETLKYTPYYETFGFWLQKAIVFPMGALCGYLSKNNALVKLSSLSVFFVIAAILVVVTHNYDSNYYDISKSCLALPVMCLLFERFSFGKFRVFLSWFGRLSLELYVIHCIMYKLMMNYFSNHISIVIAYSSALILSPVLHKAFDKLMGK